MSANNLSTNLLSRFLPPGQGNLGAAVAQMEIGGSSTRGVIRMVQTSQSTCVLDGTVDGLPAGKHRLFVHECGDISEGCNR